MNSKLTLPQQTLQLHDIVSQFVKQHNITCAESIYQKDSIAENSLYLIEQLIEVVGYADGED